MGLCLEEVRTIIQNRTDKANKMQLTYSGTLKVQWPLRSPPFLAASVAPRKFGYLTGPFCRLKALNDFFTRIVDLNYCSRYLNMSLTEGSGVRKQDGSGVNNKHLDSRTRCF